MTQYLGTLLEALGETTASVGCQVREACYDQTLQPTASQPTAQADHTELLLQPHARTRECPVPLR